MIVAIATLAAKTPFDYPRAVGRHGSSTGAPRYRVSEGAWGPQQAALERADAAAQQRLQVVRGGLPVPLIAIEEHSNLPELTVPVKAFSEDRGHKSVAFGRGERQPRSLADRRVAVMDAE